MIIPKECSDEKLAHEEPVGINTNYIFVSKDIKEKDKVMIILNGSTQMPGITSRFMMMNETLQRGTQLPHIRRAKDEGYGIVVLNGNSNGNNMKYCWENILSKLPAKKFAMITDGEGGQIGVKQVCDEEKFMEKLGAMAVTNSTHQIKSLVKKGGYIDINRQGNMDSQLAHFQQA